MSEQTNMMWKGALAGLAAGLVASFAMDRFQAVLTAASSSSSDDEDEPATNKAADRIARATTGHDVPDDKKDAAGQGVHYALGAGLGLAYGMAAEASPAVTSGLGTAFGGTVAGLLDEAAVPAVGLGPAPWKTPASGHAYTLASHMVFGVTAEITRRLVRKALG
ncbi:Protein of unknown function [Sphingomonas gellani]|uniref:DUF1440 domain-containing protein n=1 Tax=Sphingomonas gellani TaxID=1166340 RepID=A0A1H8B4M5_9SPHN|nr:DUF1440 domain-containing protein [Sphingomonas gellani]SEM77018.1 Protein of unknown function [Sphingomonas gellani]